LQANRKTKEGASHLDRDAQFQYINEQTKAFQRRGQPVVSVDTKKKELVGDLRIAGANGKSVAAQLPLLLCFWYHAGGKTSNFKHLAISGHGKWSPVSI